MDESDRGIARQGGVLGHAARYEAGSLHEVRALFECFDEPVDGGGLVLVVAINGNDALVIGAEAERIGAAQLCAEPAGTGLDEQSSHIAALEKGLIQRAVTAATVNDEDVGDGGNTDLVHPGQQCADALSFVDHGNDNGIIVALASQQRLRKGRNLPIHAVSGRPRGRSEGGHCGSHCRRFRGRER